MYFKGPGMGHFFSSSHLSTLVALFLLCHQKIFVPYIVLVTARLSCAFFAVSSENICLIYCFGHSSSQSVSQWNSFSPLKYIVYKCYSCFRPRLAKFFHRHTCLHLSRFFCCIIRKYLSHILFWSQLISVCFAMKLFFFFKIHCLQMFQTRDGPIFFIVTLVYTCRAFFAVSSENIYPIYCFGHSSSQFILQWNSFSSLKYIVYKCYICYKPEMGQFFSSSHLSALVALFLLHQQKLFVPYISAQFVSVCFAMKFFFSFKIHCLQMLLLCQSKNGSFFPTFAEMNIKLSYITGFAQNGKAEEGTCYSCHVVTA